jgi:hypothetical protein
MRTCERAGRYGRRLRKPGQVVFPCEDAGRDVVEVAGVDLEDGGYTICYFLLLQERRDSQRGGG